MNNITPITGLVFAQADGAAPPSVDGDGTATTAPAQSGSSAAPQAPMGGSFNGLFMIVLMFVVFYLLLIRPQQKKAKEHQKMLDGIKKGDEIVTNGGLIGRVVKEEGSYLTVEIADKVRVRVLRTQMAGTLASISGSDKKTEKKTEKSEKK